MKYSYLTASALGLILAASFMQPAHADAETDALRQQVKALEVRLDQLEKKQKQQVAAPAPTAAAASVSSNGSLAKQVAIIERKQENDEEGAKMLAESSPKVEVGGGKGLTVTSPDKQYSFNIHGYVQADNRTFLDRPSGASGNTDTFLVRSARPFFDAKITDYFNARFMLDFGRGQTTVLDAYGDFHPMPSSNLVNVRAGEFKVPVGLERWEPEESVLFVERGQTTNLVPYRDIGAMLYGQIIPNQLEYNVGVVNGAADLQAQTGDNDNDKDVVGRVFTNPLRWSQIPLLEGLGIGVAGTYGIHQGSTATGASGLTAGYVTTGQRTYFTYTPAAGTVFANGPQWRLNPQIMYYHGRFGAFGEYVENTQEVAKTGGADSKLQNNAWMGTASYVLTGEDAAFDGVHPTHDFDPRSDHWGAFELVGRVSKLDVDSKAFPLFASLTTSSKSAFERTAGVTWYFNNSVKLNLDFAYTTFDGGAAGGLDHKAEEAILTRTQFKF